MLKNIIFEKIGKRLRKRVQVNPIVFILGL